MIPLESEQDLIITHHIMKHHIPELVDFIQQNALESNRNEIQKVMHGMYIAQYPLEVIYDDVITAVLYNIGNLWEKGKISATEEHIASQSLKDCLIRLQGITVSPAEKLGRVLCLNLSTELHDIALKMVDQLLETKGFQVLFSGQITPALDLEKIFEKYKPDRVYISSTYNSDKEAAAAEMTMISKLCDTYDSKLYIGGRGVKDLIMPILSAVYLKSFHDVARYI
jgi:methanogenic corrinoid protein MtbC1